LKKPYSEGGAATETSVADTKTPAAGASPLASDKPVLKKPNP
jgi:hypothetical protein